MEYSTSQAYVWEVFLCPKSGSCAKKHGFMQNDAKKAQFALGENKI